MTTTRIERSSSIGLALCWFSSHENWRLHLLRWLIPFSAPAYRGACCDFGMAEWGFAFSDERTMHLQWGHHTKVIWLPWSWKQVRHSVWRPDGSWVVADEDYRLAEEEQPDGRWVGKYPYRYTCYDGEVQNVTATVSVEERECRWRWTQWLPWPRKISRFISVQFDQEVGDARGSWKGGCIGCGYKMLPGESPLETLRRMESERRFR